MHVYIYIYVYNMEHNKAYKLMIINLLKVINVNTKVRCEPRKMANFNQTVKILKMLNFRYDTET